ncbi:hypothetical protein T08_15944, partial [Trichinella sp. T8]
RRVSFPRRSGQQGLPNIAKRTRRQLAIVERDLTLYHAAAGRQHSERIGRSRHLRRVR